ncbi:hypothetical protein H109_05192 [Trichophyton interdigitale MR816]|uniref:Uncharacterized protein n=1 Tax=Trichophyton interdigitale (strain MR816) TaxID=1215338 RepID=A0A059J4V9_TRIIM|nr:hypothetical protein H109_05192 [Trichophyton interdigitale MR816]
MNLGLFFPAQQFPYVSSKGPCLYRRAQHAWIRHKQIIARITSLECDFTTPPGAGSKSRARQASQNLALFAYVCTSIMLSWRGSRAQRFIELPIPAVPDNSPSAVGQAKVAPEKSAAEDG